MTMAKFMMFFNYSSGSWARMLKVADDRVAAVEALLEYLHGGLDAIYWGVETAQAVVIADLPDSVSATAAITAATETGAFKEVQVHEVLTQEQISDVVALARSAQGVFKPPGAAAIESDISIR
jgi:uncharacterized protein with GYD domain